MNHHKNRALFLDRDGVINVEAAGTPTSKTCRFIPDIFKLVKTAMVHRYKVVVITNQGGVAYGYHTEQDFFDLMEWMQAEFEKRCSRRLDGIYHCPHHPSGRIPEYTKECEDRKPNPGMILRSVSELDIDVKKSVLVGDRWTDMLAGKAAGVSRLVLFDPKDQKPADVSFHVRKALTLNDVLRHL